MADRTVRAIFEARVAEAKKNITGFGRDVADTGKKVDGLTKDLKTLDTQKVKPKVDVELDAAKKKLGDLTRELADLKSQPQSLEVDFKIEQTKAAIKDVRTLVKDLTSQKTEVRIDAAVKDAKKQIGDLTAQLGELRTMEVTPQVTADIKAAQRTLREAKSALRDLQGAKADLKVTADTSQAQDALGDVADAGESAGEEAGDNLASGILSALQTIPIAGAVVGVGVAIAGGLLAGIKDGLKVEAGRDLFSAQTGLDEATSARFGRAAGESYANAWGDSVEANLATAKMALQAGVIDADATDAEIEQVISKLSGITDLFEYDMPMAVRAVGNALKTGLVEDADEAFDLITVASQQVAGDDLLDTINEYSTQFVQLGLTGEQAFGLIAQGAKAGARDTDVVADSIKELGLRVGEGLKPANEALESLGLNASETVSAFQKGGPEATAAMDSIFDALRKVDEQGGNTQEVIAALFGGPGEDLGAALYALDLSTVSTALGGVEGSAGAADRALATMSDNAASKVEVAKRNIEVAADGIKGALAAAFGDEVGNVADWVAKNRAPLMQFMIDVVNGAIDMGVAFAGFSATALEAIAEIADGLQIMVIALDAIPGIDLSSAVQSLEGLSDGARSGAEALRNEVPAALEEVRDRANAWAAPEILAAKLHDAEAAMSADMDAFSAKVDASGGTVTINGDKVNAEDALAALVANINAEDGTVTIDGDRVPAEDALDVLMGKIDRSQGDVRVGGDTSDANSDVSRLKSKINATTGTVKVNANTSDAIAAINAAARDRMTTITVGYRFTGTRQSQGVGGAHEGGWIGQTLPGRNAGGWVPGRDPGYDNILWPLNSGGRTLQQPLAGKEYVVNSTDSAFWGPVLEWMNAGGRPSTNASTVGGDRFVFQGVDFDAVGELVAAFQHAKRAARNRG